MSNQSKNTMVIHSCGGAGIHVADSSVVAISSLGDGFANVRFHYLDTSRANIDKIKPLGDFWQVETDKHSEGDIAGSGGERRTHATSIITSIAKYLDKYKYLERDVYEYHFVIFSASGGSGSTIGPVLIKNLLNKNIPTVAVVIGDSTNGLNAINTKNTLASLNAVALGANKPLSVIYFNNHYFMENSGNLNQAEKDVNTQISNQMVALALFLSGQNEDLDNQDMYYIIDQSNFTTITIPPGLFFLNITTGAIPSIPDVVPTVGRTLTLSGRDFETNVTLLHHKHGYVTIDNVIEIYKEDSFPMHIINYSNYFQIEDAKLDERTTNFYNIMDNIKNVGVGGTSRSKLDEDTGLVF